ncbi:hypothetical protein [Embleya hyalina]|uniref:Uncharacterized protein n=1 Tax=Embleya hyalina TaxID=516124 RepID=A0A401Z4P7_9ACTN|nr:hypothetical protein [Embleya hyalina]GCE01796.1 hypothetical protein EHYA_09570 [Embleya hyalina]
MTNKLKALYSLADRITGNLDSVALAENGMLWITVQNQACVVGVDSAFPQKRVYLTRNAPSSAAGIVRDPRKNQGNRMWIAVPRGSTDEAPLYSLIDDSKTATLKPYPDTRVQISPLVVDVATYGKPNAEEAHIGVLSHSLASPTIWYAPLAKSDTGDMKLKEISVSDLPDYGRLCGGCLIGSDTNLDIYVVSQDRDRAVKSNANQLRERTKGHWEPPIEIGDRLPVDVAVTEVGGKRHLWFLATETDGGGGPAILRVRTNDEWEDVQLPAGIGAPRRVVAEAKTSAVWVSTEKGVHRVAAADNDTYPVTDSVPVKLGPRGMCVLSPAQKGDKDLWFVCDDQPVLGHCTYTVK